MIVRTAARWILWTCILAVMTVLLLAFRGRLDKAHIVLLYLLVVLGGSATGGRTLGFALAAAAFFLFNWFFLLPYNTLQVNEPLDWLVLVTFVAVGAVAAQMMHRLRAEARTARQRAEEMDRFAALGAETLNVGRAGEALAAITDVMGATLGLDECRIHIGHAPVEDTLVSWVSENGRAAVRLADGTTRLSDDDGIPAELPAAARTICLPLQVRGRVVGVLVAGSESPIDFSPAQERFLTALRYYAALAVERVRLEGEAGHADALREADRLKSAVLASVSHDLRTPLTTIKGLAHELRSLDDRALVIEEEADRLNRLVADLLDLSRLQAAAMPLALQINPLDDLLGSLIQRVSGSMDPGRLRVGLDDSGVLLLGRFDFSAALRILVNLVENAAKYSPATEPVEVRATRRGSVITIDVADRGAGIPPAEAARIFEPFYRPAGTPPDVGGTGLGLAIARGLAEAQHGALTCEPRPSGGSIFALTLPAADLGELPTGF